MDKKRFNEVCDFILQKEYEEINEQLVEELIDYIDMVHMDMNVLMSENISQKRTIKRKDAQIDLLLQEIKELKQQGANLKILPPILSGPISPKEKSRIIDILEIRL